MTENYDVEDLSAKPLDPDHLYEYIMEHHDSERLAKLSAGVCMARQSSSGLGELSAVNNTDKIRDEFDGLEYNSLAAEARQWEPSLTPQRALDELDGSTSTVAQKSAEEWKERAEETEETDTAGEFVDRLDDYCEERDVSYGELVIMTESDSEYLERLEDSDNLCIARRDDVSAVEAERDRLIGRVGIDRDDAESLSLDSLRKIAEKDSGVTGTRPNPRSGDVLDDDDDLAQYSDRDRAADLKTRIEHLREHSGDSNDLAARQIEMYESELEDMT